MPEVSTQTITDIRRASRELVRQFGLTNQTVAGTDLSVSGVHAIIEIGLAGELSAKSLGEKLMLEKSSISRLVDTLIGRNEVASNRSKKDARVKLLRLTSKGHETWQEIEAFARNQVSTALKRVPPARHETISNSLRDYALALGSPYEDRHAIDFSKPEFGTGYTPSLIGNVISTLHAHMNRHFGFGANFEVRIASDMAEFISRIEDPGNQIWWARKEEQFQGSISIDSHTLDEGYAHLRWFIVDEKARGGGIGKALLREALSFCDERGYGEIHLWTVKGLHAARNLYEKHGFSLADEYVGDQWGSEVVEQKFVRFAGNSESS